MTPTTTSPARAGRRPAKRGSVPATPRALPEKGSGPDSVSTASESMSPGLEILDSAELDRFRPRNPRLEEMYVSRNLAGNRTDIEVLTSYWERRPDGHPLNVGLVGETQCGKTMLIEVMAFVLARRLGLTKPLPIFTLSGSSAITDHDIFGQFRPVQNDGVEQLVWMEGVVAMACRYGGILYLDEINAMPGNVTAALHPVLDQRRQFVNIRKPVRDASGGFVPEVVRVSPNLWCVCTYNPGYAGMARMNQAFGNRFQWLEWAYDKEVEEKLISSPGVRLAGAALRMARDQRAIVTPISTAALMRLEADVEQFGPDFALWAFLGQFVGANEQAKVDAIIADRSIRVLLQQEHEKRTARLARSSSRKS